MRRTAIVLALVLSVAGPAAAQEWDLYTNTQDGFKINFPGKPTITETTWTSAMDYRLPARIYSATKGQEKYTVTVVDYRPIEQQGIERSKSCPPGNSNCRANAGGTLGPGYWMHDERGAIMFATFKMIQKAELTFLGWEWQDMVEGNIMQLTDRTTKARISAYVTMHDRKLFIIEGIVPDGYPEPGLFQQSLGWVDKDGNGIRYQILYSNSYHGLGVYPVPTYGGQGGAAAGRGRGAGPAGEAPAGGAAPAGGGAAAPAPAPAGRGQ